MPMPPFIWEVLNVAVVSTVVFCPGQEVTATCPAGTIPVEASATFC
jgi:hypothetical protein